MPDNWVKYDYISRWRVCLSVFQGTELTSVDGINHKIASMSTLHTAGLNITIQIIQLFDKVNNVSSITSNPFFVCLNLLKDLSSCWDIQCSQLLPFLHLASTIDRKCVQFKNRAFPFRNVCVHTWLFNACLYTKSHIHKSS